ncbi:lisH domain-containing protein ARMC9-like [Neodiprion lecontei]|uniref:LisH domain-containing protein ARMC9-like n=1 Tax=Neodiprion lecontei TaxID=441921 RepID=A0ABM3GP07_NEOLC|nr:lisH domain-containing protein ARMC9-like [Neodiprion lecontei]
MTEERTTGGTGDIDGKSQCKPSLGELLGSFQVNDCLVKLIHQFLLYNEFESTADCLVHEAPKLGFDVLTEHLCTKNAIPKDVCKAVMSQYVAGNWKQFFNLWNNLIPQSIRETTEYKVLSFKLHLHFAVLPLRIKKLDLLRDQRSDEVSRTQMMKILENAAEMYFLGREGDDNQSKQMMTDAMEQLRTYMETDGREFEEKTDFLPFFALPCLDDDQTYTTFPELFEISWMEELTKTIQVFLMNRKQIRLTASQKTSTETMTTASRPYVCVQGNVVNVPLTCENLKDFEDKLMSMNPAGKIPMVQNDVPRMPLEITRSTIMRLIPQQTVDNIDIAPNDRNIPMFRENHNIIDRLGCHAKKRSCRIHSKSAQTRISTVTTTTNFISTSDLRQPAAVLNCSVLTKNMKTPIQTNPELSLTKSHLYSIQSNHEKLKIRFHKLHSDYHKLIGIAGELTAALENSVRGEAVDLQNMLESCITIFPDLFNHNVRENTSETKTLLDQEVELKHTDLTEAPSHIGLNINSVSPKLLDYKKIKFHLINGSVKTKLLLLQALRWKLTLSQPGDRDETVNEYLRGDILGLHAQVACDSGKQILPYLLMPKDVATPHPLQQSAARLINTLASLRCGRDYLAVGATLLNLIVKCLNGNNGESIDSFTCDMIIAMLQKMSLRKQQRLYMIETGLVEWLIFHLKSESDKIGSYRLEYATALLMNLSLHKAAQIRASAMASVVISTLTTLLATDHAPALPYINGSLNSFLSNQVINEEAKKSGLTAVLEYHRGRNSGEIRKHLDHILKIHNRDYTTNSEDYETADDDNEELDVLEDELEEGDPVKVHSGELSGEALLASCYSIAPLITQTESVNVFESRPKTPKMHSRRNSLKIPNPQKNTLSKHRNDVETPTRDIGLSPRLTMQHLSLRRKESVCQRPIATSPIKSLLHLDIPPLLSRLSAHVTQGKQTAQTYPSLSEINNRSISDMNSRASLTTATTDSDTKIEVRSNKSRTSTCSPFFCSFTRTYESVNTSDKSAQPTLKSINSPTVTRKESSTEPRQSNESQKSHRRSKALRKQKLNSVSLSERREQKLKAVRLNYSEESDNSEAAVCLYANQSSKGSSKTTLASSSTLGTACNSLVAETEKFSSIASLGCNGEDQAGAAPHGKYDFTLDNETEAFVAKPKISRTPPLTALPDVQAVHSKINPRRISTK